MRKELKGAAALQTSADCERCGKSGLGMCIDTKGNIVCLKGPCKKKRMTK